MSNLGSIISSLLSKYNSITKHNVEIYKQLEENEAIIEKKEKRISDNIAFFKFLSYWTVPMFTTFAFVSYQCSDNDRYHNKLNTATALIDRGQIEKADEVFAEIKTDYARVETEVIFSKLGMGRISADGVKSYLSSYYCTDLSKLNIQVLSPGIETGSFSFNGSLEKMIAEDGKEFLTIADHAGKIFAVAEDGNFIRTMLPNQISGEFLPIKNEDGSTDLVIGSKQGLIYKLSIKARLNEPKFYFLTSEAMIDVKSPVSKIQAFDYNGKNALFFASADGWVRGIDENGVSLFAAQHSEVALENLLPPFVTDFDFDGYAEVIHPHEQTVSIYGLAAGDLDLASPEQAMISEEIVGFVDQNNGNGSVLLHSGEKAYFFSKLDLENFSNLRPTYQKVEAQSNHHDWMTVNVDGNTVKDLVYINNDYVGVNFFGEYSAKSWQFKNQFSFIGYDQPSTPLIIKDVDGDDQLEIIVGTSPVGHYIEGRIYVLDANTGKVEHILGAESDLLGDNIWFGEIWGENYLSYVSGDSMTIIEASYFNLSRENCGD